jgi:putative FmdB family regulatory protein
MPLYEYQCKDCGSQFDLLRAMKEADAPALCKSCHSQNTTRLLSVFVAKSGGQALAGGGGSCSGCAGGNCAGCHN